MPPKRKSVPERDRSPVGRAPARSVWAVVKGENYEGSSTIGIFSSKEEAVLCAKDSIGVGKWTEEEPDRRWEEGCFYIEIQEETLWASYSDMRQHIDREIEAARKRQEVDRLERLKAGD